MYNWIDWISMSENITIKHKVNSGSEKHILLTGIVQKRVKYMILMVVGTIYVRNV